VSDIRRSNKTAALWVLTALVFLGLIVAAFAPGLRLPLIVAQVGFAPPRRAALRPARNRGLCRGGAGDQQHPGEPLHPDRLPLRPLPLHRWRQDPPSAVVHRPGLLGHRLPCLGCGNRAARRRAPQFALADHRRHAHNRRIRDDRLGPGPRPRRLDHQPRLDMGKRWGVLRRSLGQFPGMDLHVYLFMQVFALYLRSRGPLLAAQLDGVTASDLQGVLLYAATTISFFTRLFTGERTIVADAVGATWRTGDIYETSALLTVYGMCFISVLALLRMAQRRATPKALAAEVNTMALDARPGGVVSTARGDAGTTR
jgi:hypothetical protein